MVIGNGAQSETVEKGKNSFFLYGLVPGNVSDPQKMAGEAKDFEITEQQTFVDGILGVITFGIYTPTTTFVKK
jgi:hypothetical protein